MADGVNIIFLNKSAAISPVWEGNDWSLVLFISVFNYLFSVYKHKINCCTYKTGGWIRKHRLPFSFIVFPVDGSVINGTYLC